MGIHLRFLTVTIKRAEHVSLDVEAMMGDDQEVYAVTAAYTAWVIKKLPDMNDSNQPREQHNIRPRISNTCCRVQPMQIGCKDCSAIHIQLLMMFTLQAQVECVVSMCTADNVHQLLDGSPDYVLDAIDNIHTKVTRPYQGCFWLC